MSTVLILFLFTGLMKTEAQVTIGEAAPSHPASILDLRTSKGLLLSKVRLEDATKFQLSVDKVKEAAGMIIYNTNPDMKGGYGTGLYAWDGSRWNFMEENEMPKIDCTEAPKNISISGFSGTYSLNAEFDVTCNANTSGETAYIWTVPTGLTVVSGNGTKTIRLKAVVTGSYNGERLSCAVSNACGGGSSIAGASQHVTVKDCSGAPSQPGTINMPASVSLNGKFTASISAVSGATSYKWSFNGTQLSATGTSVEITATPAGSNREVKVIAVNSCGESAAKIGYITVGDCTGAPTGTSVSLSATSKKKNEEFTATANITTNGATTYSWTIPQGLSAVKDSDKQTITLKGTDADTYTVSCTVTNACGSVTVTSGSMTITGEGTEGGYNNYCFPKATHLPCWMIENSREGSAYYTYTGNGDGISNSTARGKYYSYAQATQKSGGRYVVCPAGWTLPTKQDFADLAAYLNTHPVEKNIYMNTNSYAGFCMVNGSTFMGSSGWGAIFGWFGENSLFFNPSPDREFANAELRDIAGAGSTSFAVTVRCIKRQ